MSAAATITLSLTYDMETDEWRVEATNYGRTAPSGLGAFGSQEEANAAMARLQASLDEQGKRRGASKAKIRKLGAD